MVSARGAYEMEAHDLYNAKRKQAFYSLAGMCRIVRKIKVSGLRSPLIMTEHALLSPVKITHLLPIFHAASRRVLRRIVQDAHCHHDCANASHYRYSGLRCTTIWNKLNT